MPLNAAEAQKVWMRYMYARDHGHRQFVDKADTCEKFFIGEQWNPADAALLRLQKRPALTINKIISTLSNVMGEQIYNRAEIAFRPRGDGSTKLAEVLTKVYKQISDNNQLPWKRSDAFADGCITSRGFLDARIEFDDSMQGEVRIEQLNPRNVIVDPDGEQYDPDTWNEVMTTKWLTADDIAVLYSEKDAEELRNRPMSQMPYGYDSIDDPMRGRFGTDSALSYPSGFDESNVRRNIRVIERQYRMLSKQKHFVSVDGDTRPIPEGWDRNKIAFYVQKYGFMVTSKLVHRIRWCVVADNYVLHDEWSPYKHFTVIPYFPYFRHGKTVGLVENLVGPQELLNKVSSQELHVVNTTANSGWKVKTNALRNMSLEELEQSGAKTGLVLEVNGDPDKDIVKIQPNQIPAGLERISYKAEDHIKTISGVSDSMQGFDREDVAAKAIQAKRQAGSTNIAKPLDSLSRMDFMLARNIVDLVQGFYTEHRILTITRDDLTGETEQLSINQPDPATGEIINDLTMGEYDIVISSVPQRETLEDSQFDQALAMKKEGVAIPDKFLIQNSRLMGKAELVKEMEAGQNSPEAQQQQQLALRGQAAEVAKTEAEAGQKHADTQLKLAKAARESQPEQQDGTAHAQLELQAHKTGADIQLARDKFQHERQMDIAKHEEEQRVNDIDAAMQAEEMQQQREQERAQAAAAAAQPQKTAQSTK